jgi:hypothetical protein
MDIQAKRYERESVFNLAAAAASFRIINYGSTNSPLSTFHVAERNFYSL